MRITKEQVEKVAGLARLSLSEEEKEQMTKDMEQILDFADQINKLEFEDVNAAAYVLPMDNVFREDKVAVSMNRDELLKNAPSKENGCFSVPKVVE